MKKELHLKNRQDKVLFPPTIGVSSIVSEQCGYSLLALCAATLPTVSTKVSETGIDFLEKTKPEQNKDMLKKPQISFLFCKI